MFVTFNTQFSNYLTRYSGQCIDECFFVVLNGERHHHFVQNQLHFEAVVGFSLLQESSMRVSQVWYLSVPVTVRVLSE